jgi:beta-lactamase class D
MEGLYSDKVFDDDKYVEGIVYNVEIRHVPVSFHVKRTTFYVPNSSFVLPKVSFQTRTLKELFQTKLPWNNKKRMLFPNEKKKQEVRDLFHNTENIYYIMKDPYRVGDEDTELIVYKYAYKSNRSLLKP